LSASLAMRFLIVFLTAAAVFSILYGGVIRIVDPHGDFGTGGFPVVGLHARSEKMQLFKAYAAAAAPEGLIVGWSRAMKRSPRTLESQTGHRFFNFAVETAHAEDELAIYRWVRQQGVRIKVLVIGLDVEALHSDDRPDVALLGNEALMETLDRG